MELLEKLCMGHGVSGFESEIAELMERELRKVSDETIIDKFGNIIARRGRGKTKIMLAAHMDEVGLMIKHIDKEGYISFVKIGGIDDRILLNRRVIIKSKKGDVRGVIGYKPPHLQKEEEKKKVVKHDEMFIDIGCSSEKEASKLVSVGDTMVFESNFAKLTKNRYSGKALDDRLGCYCIVEIMKALPKSIDATIFAVGTTQEEVGLKGARVSAFKLEPDYAIAVDTTIAGDTPGIRDIESSLKLGKGPAITITEAAGRGVITHPKVKEILIKTAKRKKIPYQIDVLEGGMTDAAIIYLTKEGIPSGAVSIPTRYIHGPTGVFDTRDVKNTIKLVTNSLLAFTK